MSNYEQYMKHSKNHRKDRFTQQCSGYFGKALRELRSEENVGRSKETYWIENGRRKKIGSSDTWKEIIEKEKPDLSKIQMMLEALSKQ